MIIQINFLVNNNTLIKQVLMLRIGLRFTILKWEPFIIAFDSRRRQLFTMSCIMYISAITSFIQHYQVVANYFGSKFLLPSLSSQLRVFKRPSIYTRLPLCKYFCARSASPRHNTTVCHSVCDINLPLLSLYVSVVAKENFATAILPSRICISGLFLNCLLTLPCLPLS